MKIEIEGHVVEASAVAVTVIGDCPETVMDTARKLIEHAHGREAIVFQRHGEVEQRQDHCFECDVELRDNHPANAHLSGGEAVRSDTLLDAVLGHVRAAYWKYEGKDSAFVAHLADAQRLLMEAQATASNAPAEAQSSLQPDVGQ